MQKHPKSKITYSNLSLSALAIANLAKALGSEVPITKSAKPLAAEKPEIFNVELHHNASLYYGELTILSFLLNDANANRTSD
jgi:hypothetical protein